MHADTEVLLLPKTELFYFLTAVSGHAVCT